MLLPVPPVGGPSGPVAKVGAPPSLVPTQVLVAVALHEGRRHLPIVTLRRAA